MYGLEIYRRVRHAVLREGMSEREATTAFGVDRGTISTMTSFSEPPGYRLKARRPRSRMDEHSDFVDQILLKDQDAPKKQRHTIQRIFERLRDERKFAGGYTTVRDYVRPRRQHLLEAFVPLVHPAGHAQADFGEATVFLAGVEQKVRFFVMSLPQSDAVFVKAYHAETAEAFCDGHVEAFAFFRGVPLSILYDNTKLAVAQILGPFRRMYHSPAGQRTELASAAECSRRCNRTICSMTGLAARRRAMIKATWKGWLASPAALSWFRSQMSPTLMN